jgi:hypothetical protein
MLPRLTCLRRCNRGFPLRVRAGVVHPQGRERDRHPRYLSGTFARTGLRVVSAPQFEYGRPIPGANVLAGREAGVVTLAVGESRQRRLVGVTDHPTAAVKGL